MTYKNKKYFQEQNGFTIIEVIFVVAITSIIVLTLVRFLVAGYPLSKTTYLQVKATDTARLQLKRLVKMLREARPSDTGSYPLVETKPQKIIFYADVDADMATERIRFELDGTQLVKGVVKPSGDPIEYNLDAETEQVVLNGIQNGADPIFTYYSGDYPADDTPLGIDELSDVKYIEFNLIVDADPAIDPPAADVQSQVQLRNLKTNLGETVE